LATRAADWLHEALNLGHDALELSPSGRGPSSTYRNAQREVKGQWTWCCSLTLSTRSDRLPAPRRTDMPLYLDVHHKINGLTTEGIADAHRKDLECQHKHGVNYLKYWFDEGTGKVFCLVQAPSKEAAEAVHREAHGALADEIIEVKEGS
jgi:hypothetical protein